MSDVPETRAWLVMTMSTGVVRTAMVRVIVADAPSASAPLQLSTRLVVSSVSEPVDAA